ncbi:hypothetical protein LEP1GSC133_1583 [Leptospira borgpetersenii serovar Pomona str. 200901868]|uniref:Uncharacterized protein n=1 Tax=Leptospira borgpetersenii serovar Pomona str. 200901868 TaxID=1192866 RepID=M6WTY1_LEPBO|nr:hypothetical protein LEP1GSC133_1583 [Leptospira borgpetersenii serovar Pomona str. 200901868]
MILESTESVRPVKETRSYLKNTLFFLKTPISITKIFLR